MAEGRSFADFGFEKAIGYHTKKCPLKLRSA